MSIYTVYILPEVIKSKNELKMRKVLRNITSYGKIYELHVKFCNDMCRVLSFVKFCWRFWATQKKQIKNIKIFKKILQEIKQNTIKHKDISNKDTNIITQTYLYILNNNILIHLNLLYIKIKFFKDFLKNLKSKFSCRNYMAY